MTNTIKTIEITFAKHWDALLDAETSDAYISAQSVSKSSFS
jgi:hypothetical protein